MNEFTAKKLGEVLAFALLGIETVKKAGDPLKEILGGEFVEEYIEKNIVHSEEIKALSQEAGSLLITNTKCEGTLAKIRGMRDAYIGDKWSNPTEVLEWMGFAEGAAQVHWAIVQGAGRSLNSDAFISLAAEGEETHRLFLEKVASELESIGEERGAPDEAAL